MRITAFLDQWNRQCRHWIEGDEVCPCGRRNKTASAKKMTFLQTPNRISEALATLCRKVSFGYTPEFIYVEPIPDFLPDNCYPNVQSLVATKGGEAVFGWAIYEWPRVWVEFQHHAVWRDTEGKLRDHTPRRDGESIALFLTCDISYIGSHIPTKWFPLSDSIDILRIIEIQVEINNLKAAYYNKMGENSKMDQVSAQPVIRLEEEKSLILVRMNYVPSRNDLCPCMSRKKFKHCHGR